MRYLIHVKHEHEVTARKAYIEEITHLYFVQQNNVGNYIVLQSFPLTSLQDICLVYGHNYAVEDLIQDNTNDIHEKNVFIITCLINSRDSFMEMGKNVYISPQTNNTVVLRDGSAYGFEFPISDTELNVYNSPATNIWDKLISAFQKL